MAKKGRVQKIDAVGQPAAPMPAGVDGEGGGPHDPRMDAMIQRVDRLEEDVRGIRGTLKRLEPLIVRIDERLSHVATREDLGIVRTELKEEIGATRSGLKAESVSLRAELKGDINKLGERLARLEGAMERLPTTLQLPGFVLAVLGIAGLAKYFAP